MKAKNIDTIMLFGVHVSVSRTVAVDEPVYNPRPLESFTSTPTMEMGSWGGGRCTLFLLQERPIQESDQKGVEVSAAHDVNTSLRLLSIGTPAAVSRNTDDPLVHNPMPLRSSPTIVPKIGFSLDGKSACYFSQKRPFQESEDKDVNISETDQVDTSLGLSPAAPRITDENAEKSRKRKQKNVSDEKKGISVKRRRNNGGDDQKSEPIPSLEEIPGILQTIESHNGTRPVFLYRKRLEESDVRPDQNRLFVTRSEKLMEFLTEDERNVVINTNEGLDFFAIDQQGKFYKLHLGKWTSLKMLILNKEWKKLVLDNNMHKGDCVDIWGYRRNDQLCLAVNFRKS
ncbi:hypothetical protein Pfo_007525 [Paulownia fortunei]|nr:hypothetical protein Pfo_007525 [Paulownia fortunei]